MNRTKIIKTAIAIFAFSSSLNSSVFGQGTTTLRNPLIPGAQGTIPFIPPAPGQPPAVGDGPTPVEVNPGMIGAPTALPWVPNAPANIGGGFSGVGLPFSPDVAMPPGALGPALTGFTPSPPSTPGFDPGPLRAPVGSRVPADLVNINPMGGMPGVGGYYTSINKQRRGGQQTHQFDRRGRRSIFGGGGDGSQDVMTLLGPLAGSGVPNGVPTGNGYNRGLPGTNDALRSSSIDLGGGMRTQLGGSKISRGSSLQDYGLSDMRNPGLGPLRAHQSTEFGQGFRGMPVFSHKTTDFGLPYAQFNPANLDPQKTGQRLLPAAVQTNF